VLLLIDVLYPGPSRMTIKVDEIIDGIEEELRVTSKFVKFRVERRTQEGAIWKLNVEPMSGSLDESLEESSAWWAGPPSGSAAVLSVIPEIDQINLWYASTTPPDKGQEIRLYPPRYLEALLDCWQNRVWANRCLQWLDSSNKRDGELDTPERIPGFSRLRINQRRAFSLLEQPISFLWGPPGTGKTFTLGAMLAHYLCEHRTAKVLLLSTTNSAVDQALISVDDRLQELSRTKPFASELRKKCLRIGNHFVASQYKGKEHLLPASDVTLIRAIAELEANPVDPTDVARYAQWKARIRALRQQIPKPLDRAQLAALTTTGAAFMFEPLYARHPFDLIVFDEASQVGLAHALALAPLGKQVIFAGDPQQLAPIAKSEHPNAKAWLGESMFAHRRRGHECLLDEQNRMEESICDVVSNVFYEGKLLVAQDAEADPVWRLSRVVADVAPMGRKNVHIHLCREQGMFHGGFGGPVRFESADFIGELVQRLAASGLAKKQITVLTPYRAQRTIIRNNLRRKNIRDVRVSTVHRAQGTECHTVIFDVLFANTEFFDKEMGGARLINVAVSRAQSRLIIVASEADLSYDWLRRVSNVISHRDGAGDDAVPLADVIFQPTFPISAVGTIVRYNGIVGKVTGAQARFFPLMNLRNGDTINYKTELVRSQLKSPATRTAGAIV